MVIVPDQRLAVVPFPLDAKEGNVQPSGDNTVVETIPQYLERNSYYQRYLGLEVPIVEPAGTYQNQDYLNKIDAEFFTVTRYGFTYGIQDADFLPLSSGGGGGSTFAVNIGDSGIGIYDSKVGDILEFRKVDSGNDILAVSFNNSNQTVDFTIDETKINHNNLLNFITDKHIDHSLVSIQAGEGLSGGGTIQSSRTLKLDLSTLTEEATALLDYIGFYDLSQNKTAKITIDDFIIFLKANWETVPGYTNWKLSINGEIASDITDQTLVDLIGSTNILVTRVNNHISFEVNNRALDHNTLSGIEGGTIHLDSSQVVDLHKPATIAPASSSLASFGANQVLTLTAPTYAALPDKPPIPSSLWELTGVDRTGWFLGGLLKFNSSGDLVVGSDLTSAGGTGISLADLFASPPLSYNNSTGYFSVASGYTIPTNIEKATYDNAPNLYKPINWFPTWDEVNEKPTFATVATSGNYTDLFNTPPIPTQYTNSDARAAISLTTNFTSGQATYNSVTGVLNVPQYTSGSGIGYPGVGIALSTGNGWDISIPNASGNWNTAYIERRQWDGGSTNLNQATGRTSLGLGTAALNATGDFVPIANNGKVFIGAQTITALPLSSYYFTSSGGYIQPVTSDNPTQGLLLPITSGSVYNALITLQPLDGDLTSIAGLSGTSGFLKKIAANSWGLDTTTYLQFRTFGTAANNNTGDFVPVANEGLVKLTSGPSLGALNASQFSLGSGVINFLGYSHIIQSHSDVYIPTVLGPAQAGQVFYWTGSNWGIKNESGGGVTQISTTSPITGGPITSTGTIGLASAYGDILNPYASKTANYILASPSGTSGTPSFRALTSADIPILNQSTTGSAGSVLNALNYTTSGAGTTLSYNGSVARTISYNSVGAAALAGNSAQDFSIKVAYLGTINSCNVNGNDGVAKLVCGAYALTLNNTGRVDVTTLVASGNITALNFILSGSDRRLKQNIEVLEKSNIDSINFVKYTMKSDITNRQRYGVIAQEVEEIMPELVVEQEDGTKLVNYIDLLVAKIVSLEERIKFLENGK